MTADELLRQRFTPDEYDAYKAGLNVAVREAVAEEVAKAIAQTTQEVSVMPVVKGLLKSVTVWLGAFMATMPEWWPLVQDQVTSLLGPNAAVKVVGIMGILTILVRFKTTESLRDKGAPKDPV